MGRPITEAKDPRAVVESVLKDLSAGRGLFRQLKRIPQPHAVQIHNPHSALAALETRPATCSRSGFLRAGTDAGVGSRGGARAQKSVSVRIRPRMSGESGRAPRWRQARRPTGARARPKLGARARRDFGRGAVSRRARARGGHGLWLALDYLQDPHNVGAIFRAAAFFGVRESFSPKSDRPR